MRKKSSRCTYNKFCGATVQVRLNINLVASKKFTRIYCAAPSYLERLVASIPLVEYYVTVNLEHSSFASASEEENCI